jgi:hypothetical protein
MLISQYTYLNRRRTLELRVRDYDAQKADAIRKETQHTVKQGKE